MKLKYQILFYGLPHYIPQAVTARSGRTFGHATYNEAHKAHLFEFTEEQWNSHSIDTCNALKRRQARWSIKAVIVPDEGSIEDQQAAEIDRLKFELDNALDERKKDAQTIVELVGRIADLEKAAGQPQPEPLPKPVMMAAPTPQEPPKQEEQPPVEENQAPASPVADMSYRDLRAIAIKANEQKADTIKLNPAPKKEELAAAVAKLPNLEELIKLAA